MSGTVKPTWSKRRSPGIGMGRLLLWIPSEHIMA
jgi:hypothetical protein